MVKEYTRKWSLFGTILYIYCRGAIYRGGQFIDGGNWCTRRKPPTCCKSL